VSATGGFTTIILTFNEERNLPACLESLGSAARDVFVLDSGSTDRTVTLARTAGARVVVHPFETHARQWAWALEHLPIQTDWVLGLDADQRLTPELRAAIVSAIAPGAPEGGDVGYYVNRRQVFRGQWIKHGGYYPKYLLKLFRRSRVRFDDGELVDHHFHVDGPSGHLRGDLIEDNQNEARIFEWIEKHNRYARAMAAEEIDRLDRGAPRGRWFGTADERTARLKSIWVRLPLYWRPLGYFLYRYVIRMGFLDGKQGLIFHFMQAFWYRLLVDINRDELDAARLRHAALARPDDREALHQSSLDG
jgi:glycosyltransferase involved in cell wall biosynthesis